MKKTKLKVKNLNTDYSIIVGRNILSQISYQIRYLCPNAQKIALVVDKNVNDLARIADMHYIIEKGRIVWEGTSPELLEQKDFLGNKLGV